MNIAQLKLHATRTRALLEQANHAVSHSQALDLVAALPGLRNWPEVHAFPNRVSSCELDLSSTGRLAFRLKKKFDMEVSPHKLLADLGVPILDMQAPAPHIWPAGPQPGVYITTSQDAIDALMDQYEEASDGALVYAEKAGNHKNSSIDLGDNGLWSSGLSRVPSGTLLVVGPLKLDQQSWNDSAQRLQMACINAQTSGHRVAVLLQTPTLATLHADVMLMVRQQQSDSDGDDALAGVVTVQGNLELRVPFALPAASPRFVPTVATVDAIPLIAREPLRQALQNRKSGIVLLGSGLIGEHWAVALVNACLAMTEHVGPAARIMPRHRSNPEKDWQVPDGIKQLPYLASVESAYAQGYRRLVVNPTYTNSEVFLEYGKDALFIGGGYASGVEETFMAMRAGSTEEAALLERTIALLAVTEIPVEREKISVADLFINDWPTTQFTDKRYGELLDFLLSHRSLKMDDQLWSLINQGKVDLEALKSLSRNRGVSNFLATNGLAEQ